MRIKKRWPLLSLLIGAALGGYWFFAIPATAVPNGSASTLRLAPGPFDVINEAFEAADDSRTMQAYREFPGSPVRKLQGELWRPARQTAGPLLVYSHGFMSFHQEGLYLARYLASHGYTVLAVDYPLTGYSAPDGPFMRDVVSQPGDISFLLDTVLQRNSNPADPLHATIDPTKIAVAGTSLGGLTSLLTAYHRKLRDPRIAAVISIAGPTSMLTAQFFAGSNVPLLMIYGDGDVIVPYQTNATPVLLKQSGSILVSLKDGSHAGFAQPASTLMRFMANPDTIGCRAVREGLKDELAAQQDGFMSLLGGTEDGIETGARIEICTSPPVPEAMQSARQHMFTNLASYAFLQSVFEEDRSLRDTSRQYLLETLPLENASEITVSF